MSRETVMRETSYPGNGPKPPWLKIRVREGEASQEVEKILRGLHLHTVCEEATCPNRMECFGSGTATFMVLGKNCTRNCRFCDVNQDDPEPVDTDEPAHVADAVRRLNLRHVVVTSVTRDDLPDGGAGHFAEIVRRVHAVNRDTAGRQVLVEVLIPDFGGQEEPLRLVAESGPDVLNHNVETVPRLYNDVRPMADYRRSLTLLERAKAVNGCMITKSGIMAGLGGKDEEVLAVLRNLRAAGCDFLTIGQYLAPSKGHYPVQEYVHPDTFEMYREKGLEMGFRAVASGPFVRSSYHAGELYRNVESSDC